MRSHCTKHQTWAYFKQGICPAALLRQVWRNTVRNFYLSLRPPAWATAKGRFPDLSDQLFHKSLVYCSFYFHYYLIQSAPECSDRTWPPSFESSVPVQSSWPRRICFVLLMAEIRFLSQIQPWLLVRPPEKIVTFSHLYGYPEGIYRLWSLPSQTPFFGENINYSFSQTTHVCSSNIRIIFVVFLLFPLHFIFFLNCGDVNQSQLSRCGQNLFWMRQNNTVLHLSPLAIYCVFESGIPAAMVFLSDPYLVGQQLFPSGIFQIHQLCNYQISFSFASWLSDHGTLYLLHPFLIVELCIYYKRLPFFTGSSCF